MRDRGATGYTREPRLFFREGGYKITSYMNANSRPGVTGEEPEGYVLSFGDFFRTLRERVWIILLTVILALGVALTASLLQQPTYEASTSILVGQEQGTSTSGNLGGDIQGLEQLTQTMVEAVSSRPLAQAVIEQLGLSVTPEDFLEERLSVQQIPETQFIEVSYTDGNPERAQQVTNTMGEVFVQQVSEISPEANAVTATVWEPAAVPDEPVSPQPLLYVLVALVIGTLLGVGLALLLDNLDDSWRSPEEAEQVSGVPTFGVIPTMETTSVRKKGRS